MQPARRFPLLLLLASLSLSLCAVAGRPGVVDGWSLTRDSATWYSVCVASSAPSSLPPAEGPLAQPSVSPDTEGQPLVVKQGIYKDCVAWGFHSDDIEKVGWSYLSIQTSAEFTDELQSRAAGVLEGYMSQQRILQNVRIINPRLYPHGLSDGVRAWLNDSVNFQLSMAQAVGDSDDYWAQIRCLYLQLGGLLEGYMLAAPSADDAVSWFDLLTLQLDTDVSDITTAVGLYSPLATPEERARAEEKMSAKIRPTAELAETHCSVLIKLLPRNTDLLAGHTTWSSFNTALRTFKLYDMPMRTARGSRRVHISSYPGFISYSSDDWYQLEPSLLTVTETSNDIYNSALYAAIQPGSVFNWARTIVANRLARDGGEWVDVYSRYNSGTCDNQWSIVDHKRFKPGDAKLQPGLLTVTEQMPGQFTTQDLTPLLAQQGYWSSFNIPYFNSTYAVSGYDLCPGDAYTCGWSGNFRQLLFAQLAPNVVNLDLMRRAMQYNDWAVNPLQRNNSQYAIAARYDLRPNNPTAYGGLDGKITADSWMKAGQLRVTAYSGPTTDDQPPFCWNDRFPRPDGLPLCFDFPWIDYTADPLHSAAAVAAPAASKRHPRPPHRKPTPAERLADQ